MSDELTLGSLFSGGGGFEKAALNVGIIPKWASEIAPFPTLVGVKNFPNIKHYGNITKLKGNELESVDIISGGFPCQDLSIAGKRAGLDGNRSGLFFEFIRIVKEMRNATNGRYPRYMLFENVPGAYSSNGGEDFRVLLSSIANIKDEKVSIPKPKRWANAGCILGRNFSLAWRTIDAQYFGVPQRRKRIYALADFSGQSAGEILFESESLRGDNQEGREKKQEVTKCNDDGTSNVSDEINRKNNISFSVCSKKSDRTENGKVAYETAKSSTLDTRGVNPNCNQGGMAVVSIDQGAGKYSSIVLKEKAPPLTCGHGGSPAVSYGINGGLIGRKDKNGPNSENGIKEKSYTLNTMSEHAVAYSKVHSPLSANDGPKGPSSQMLNNPTENFVTESYGLSRTSFMSGNKADFGISMSKEKGATLESSGPGAIAHYSTSKASFHICPFKDKTGTLCASDFMDPPTITDSVNREYIIRRLIPLECGRLQGFPDNWCDDLSIPEPTDDEMKFWINVFNENAEIENKRPLTEMQIRKWLKSPCSDAQVYKLWGNGIALPCAEFVFKRIKGHIEKEKKENV